MALSESSRLRAQRNGVLSRLRPRFGGVASRAPPQTSAVFLVPESPGALYKVMSTVTSPATNFISLGFVNLQSFLGAGRKEKARGL